MSIKEYFLKIKREEVIEFDAAGEPVRHSILDKVFLALVIFLVGALGYGVGRLTAGPGRSAVEIRYGSQASSPVSTSAADGSVYASSKGTKYYYPNCQSSISDKNKVVFASAALAEEAGYALAATCPGP